MNQTQVDIETRRKAKIDANRAFINSKSDKVLYSRFCQDYKSSCEALGLKDDDIDTKVTCAKMSELFLHLGFIQPKELEKEQILLAQIWKLIGGDPAGECLVNLLNVKAVMCCI